MSGGGCKSRPAFASPSIPDTAWTKKITVEVENCSDVLAYLTEVTGALDAAI